MITSGELVTGQWQKQDDTFLFPVFVGVLLGDNEKDEDDENQQQTDPDAIEPTGRRQVKVSRSFTRHVTHTHTAHSPAMPSLPDTVSSQNSIFTVVVLPFQSRDSIVVILLSQSGQYCSGLAVSRHQTTNVTRNQVVDMRQFRHSIFQQLI